MTEFKETTIESFTKRDVEATQMAREQIVEPSGVSHAKHKTLPLVDYDETLFKVTDNGQLLAYLNNIHDRMAENVSTAIGEPFAGTIPISNHEVVIGSKDNPDTWVRVAPTRSDVEEIKLNVFLNINHQGLVDYYTLPPGTQVDQGVINSINLSDINPQTTVHRRTGKQGRRFFDENHVVTYDLNDPQNENVSIWLVSKQ